MAINKIYWGAIKRVQREFLKVLVLFLFTLLYLILNNFSLTNHISHNGLKMNLGLSRLLCCLLAAPLLTDLSSACTLLTLHPCVCPCFRDFLLLPSLPVWPLGLFLVLGDLWPLLLYLIVWETDRDFPSYAVCNPSITSVGYFMLFCGCSFS